MVITCCYTWLFWFDVFSGYVVLVISLFVCFVGCGVAFWFGVWLFFRLCVELWVWVWVWFVYV